MRFLFLTSKPEGCAKTIANALTKLSHQVDIIDVPAYIYSEALQQKIHGLITKHHYQVIHAFSYPSLLIGFQSKSVAKKIVTVDSFSEVYGTAPTKPVMAHALLQYDIIHVANTDLAAKIKTQTRRLALIVPEPDEHLDELYGITL